MKRGPTQEHSTLLTQILSRVARRYRLPIRPEDAIHREHHGVASRLASIIERVRETVVSGRQPDAALKKQFLDTLARLIHDAMLDDEGDSAFQAMTLRHGAPRVREYASLAARSDPDRRAVLALVNTMAHPARQERTGDASLRAALAAVHDAASEQAWTRLHTLLRELARIGATSTDTDVSRPAAALLEHPALARLQRLEALRADEQVGRYLKLWEKNGPRTGSDEALREGARSRRRGAAVEALAAKALTVLAEGLNEVETTGAIYRVVTSLRVPAAILNGRERAKSEWDAVLLGRSAGVSDDQGWDVCLLLEAKASADAAATDLPRLLRGLEVLSQAEEESLHSFQTTQGEVRLSGASLRRLSTDEARVAATVLYCSDAPAGQPRLLSAAARMQLLSTPASLDFAAALADGSVADPASLEPVWLELLGSPRWSAVLHQYPTLRQARELMVHVDDLRFPCPSRRQSHG